MRKILLGLLFLWVQLSLTAQVLEFDQLEMRYDQKQYKSVYRKANRLLDNPVYDFSYIPRYYLALSKLQLAQNEKWRRRHKYSVEEAKETFTELRLTHEGREVLRAHQYELSVLKNDLTQWMYELNLDGDRKTFNQIEELVQTIFSDIPDVSDMKEDQIVVEEELITEKITSISEQRANLLKLSNDLLGVPYKWAGNTPKGFDCSGFTNYVTEKELNQSLSRRAADQYKEATKVKRKNVQPGDFVFFDNGSGISHVGIVYSTQNNSIQMIHASTSIGISIVDIYQSSYWKQRIAGFGTYFKD
ncbi:MAG TPA: C40 family peptidase [Brumimicrobium sp.]|nr:C40 family peptidase [Brumimicrobium sp.]